MSGQRAGFYWHLSRLITKALAASWRSGWSAGHGEQESERKYYRAKAEEIATALRRHVLIAVRPGRLRLKRLVEERRATPKRRAGDV